MLIFIQVGGIRPVLNFAGLSAVCGLSTSVHTTPGAINNLMHRFLVLAVMFCISFIFPVFVCGSVLSLNICVRGVFVFASCAFFHVDEFCLIIVSVVWVTLKFGWRQECDFEAGDGDVVCGWMQTQNNISVVPYFSSVKKDIQSKYQRMMRRCEET